MVCPKRARNSSRTCGGKGRGAGDEEAHGGADLARGFGGNLEEAHVNGGYAEEEGGAEIEKRGGGLLILEALQQAHAAAAGEPAVQTIAEGVHVKQGQGEEETVCRGDLPAGEQGDGVGGEVVVGEDGAFGRAGGAGGVDDAGRGIAIQGNGGALGGHSGGFGGEFGRGPNGDGCGEGLGGDDGVGVRVLQDVGTLAIAVEDVDGDEDDA